MGFSFGVSIGFPSEWLRNWILYWRKFRGRRVQIVTKHIHQSPLPAGTKYWRKIYIGKVDAVVDNPPGIILTSVTIWMASETYIVDTTGNEQFFPLTPSGTPASSTKQLIFFENLDDIKFLDCRICGNPLIYIEEYGRWYCERCRKYD